MALKRGASEEAGSSRNKRKKREEEDDDEEVESSSSSSGEEGDDVESGSGSDSDDSGSDGGGSEGEEEEEETGRSPGKSPSKVTAMGFENDGFVVDDEDNEGSDDGDGSSDSSSSEDEASDLDPDDIDDGDLLIVKETNPEAYARIMARKAAAAKAGEGNADSGGAAVGAEGGSSAAGGTGGDSSDDDSLLGGRKKGFSRLKKQKDFTKAQHITATSADALEDRLFDDDDFADVAGGGGEQGRSLASRGDRRDEDSDNDSLADFIVTRVREAGDAGRDDDDDDLPNRGREYAERYGEDMAGLLQEIDEVFGDARVLNLAAGRMSAMQQQQEEDRDVDMAEGGGVATADPEKDLEARFDPEEVAARFVTAKDQAIARANIPERYQAVYGPNTAARCIAAFKAVPVAVGAEGMALDPAEAESAARAATDKEMYNQEWSIEAKWIYAKIRERADVFANPDAYSTTPASYSQVFADDTYKFQIIPLIEVLLRDVKGRGYEIPTIWNGMLRCKYRPVLEEQDLWTIMDFDRQWVDIKKVKQNMAEKLQGYKDSLQRALDIDNELMEQAITEHADKEAMSPELRDRVVKANSQITMILARLDDLSSSQIEETYAEALKDISLMISVQVEPKLRRLESTGLQSLAIVHKSHLRVDDSLYRVITDAGLDKALEEVIGMDSQQLGESLLVGHNFAPAIIDRPPLADWVHAQCQGKSGLIFHNERRLVDALAQFTARNIVDANIKIYLRCRPTGNATNRIHPSVENNTIDVRVGPDEDERGIEVTKSYINNSRNRYRFKCDKVFGMAARQDDIFDVVARPTIEECLKGINGTIFAYGQTGSGKTFTITGGTERYVDRGIIPRSVSYIFERIGKLSDAQYRVYISYLEIYNDNGYDLLYRESDDVSELHNLPSVSLQEDEDGQMHLRGLSVNTVPNEEEALNLLFLGDTNRVVAETPMNDSSTRSHCMFIIWIEATIPGSDTVRRSKLHLVDLAGSERIKKTQVGGQLANESRFINVSLHFLEQVIVCLHEKSIGKRSHIPYRNSMMTSVLRDSLGGNCRTSMIGTLSMDGRSIEESISTCRFAQRVGLIKNEARVNEEIDPSLLIRRLKRQVAELQEELRILKGDQQEEVLTSEDLSHLRALVESYIKDGESTDSHLVCGSMKKIQACFSILRDMVTKPMTDTGPIIAARSAPKGSDEAQVQQLQLQIAQRDQELAVLLGMLNKSSDSALPEGGCDQSRVRPAVDSSGAQGGAPHHPSTVGSAEWLEHITGESPATLLLDRQRCFELFRKSIRRTETLTENKELLRKLCEEAKALGKEANTARDIVNREKESIDKVRKRAILLGHDGDKLPEEYEKEIRSCTQSIEEQTAVYKACADKLRGVRSDIERIQKMMEQSRMRLQKDFEKWYASIRRHVDVNSLSKETKKEILDKAGKDTAEHLRKYEVARENILNAGS
ncbi:krp3, putative [Perkinsus marinus ATCC 50983]|uniref:Krp3, putative n=1 Tax=Perkinsus marinus (strain ATCC 50983 / TXsc) TaxID=423536 RepID=C5KH19_PERM5|nr:krp3, putative [Perkinsus marinus ATCC 50983]EER15881.1 krp3, putative [Perkinsus marinus ATCC 50983]|eukprot:XP_002784085.1 krp3, putative [Perkinsus marinus ATCC 50983]